jgi:hypothetical protein
MRPRHGPKPQAGHARRAAFATASFADDAAMRDGCSCALVSATQQTRHSNVCTAARPPERGVTATSRIGRSQTGHDVGLLCFMTHL